MRLAAHWMTRGCASGWCAGRTPVLRRERRGAQRPLPLSPARCLALRSGSELDGASRGGVPWTAPPPRLARPGARVPLSLLLAEDGTRVPRGGEVVATAQSGCCTRRGSGERPARRVWCSDVGAPADGNADSSRGQGRTALSVTTAEKNGHNPLSGVVCLLTTGVLIRVRRGLAPSNIRRPARFPRPPTGCCAARRRLPRSILRSEPCREPHWLGRPAVRLLRTP
jgi:hypothetical protein